jgi:hypothetical protein
MTAFLAGTTRLLLQKFFIHFRFGDSYESLGQSLKLLERRSVWFLYHVFGLDAACVFMPDEARR